MALQADGKVFVAGGFTTVSGVARRIAACLLAENRWTPDLIRRGSDNTVYAVAVQPDGNVLIGGAFTTVNGFSRGRIARLNGDPDAGSTELKVIERVTDGRAGSPDVQQPGRQGLSDRGLQRSGYVGIRGHGHGLRGQRGIHRCGCPGFQSTLLPNSAPRFVTRQTAP